MEIDNIRLSNGILIPKLGMGTYPLQGNALINIIDHGVRIGYRLIDTSDDYKNEEYIGVAVKRLISEGQCTRNELFLQTKISDNGSYSDEPLRGKYFCKYSNYMKTVSVYEVVEEKINNSMKQFQTDYLDCVLIHVPYPDFYIKIWKALEIFYKNGVIRVIGVSNFEERNIENIKKECEILPMINQLYLSPIGTKKRLIEYCQNNNIQVMTYSPLIDIKRRLYNNKVILKLCKKYNKSMAQILLRWNIQCGSIPLPKTASKLRLEENAKIFDFDLSYEDMNLLDNLNYDFQYLPLSKMCPGF
jgi:diketogulonate reductase-like aldo/keto reductase